MTAIGRLRQVARACFDAAVQAVDPTRLVGSALARDGDRLLVAGDPALVHVGPVLLVAAGKGAAAMADAAVAWAGVAHGVVVAPDGAATRGTTCVGGPPPAAQVPSALRVHRAGHPVPDVRGARAADDVLAAVAAAGPDTLVLVLLSGGASALLVAPAAGLSLADKQDVTRALLGAGADIVALNAVRKHCSRLKGGGLARAAARAAACWTLALSDVVGDDPSVIASGPTVPDPGTFADAAAVLDRFLARDAVPAAVAARVAAGCAGRVPETPKPGDPVFARATWRLLGSNRTALAAAAGEAARHGFRPVVLDEPLTGDAAEAGRTIAARLAHLPGDAPVALVAGGETTVRVVAGGRGGRCQHLALAAAIAMAGAATSVLLAAGTDGVDGPTDAAGGVVDGATVARAAAAGVDARRALDATDSHRALEAADDLVRIGPTGTNVADLVVALRPAC